jgi:hypothetical protein
MTEKTATKGFVQLGHDFEATIGSAHPGFGFGGQPAPIHRGNSASH